MTTIPITTLVQSIADLLTEVYAGSPNPNETWFSDNQPEACILGVLAGITAAEASLSVDGSGQSGSTIAANVEHLRWSLANANGALRGETFQTNWTESWKLLQTEDARWDTLRQELRTEFETLHQAILKQGDLPGAYLNGVLALIPHASYHLGTIHQMIARVRSGAR